MLFNSPTLSLNNGDSIKKQVVSAIWPTSFFFWYCMSSRNTRLLEDRVNNSRNYILDDFVNGLAKESNNKDGENIINKGKAENNSDGSNNSDNIDNDNSGNSNSSNSDEGNKAYRYIGWQGLPTLITS